jgi:uncharacterized membrane protein
VTKVNDPKGLATICEGISPNGSAIVGYYINSMGKNFGFLLKGKTFTDVLGLKGATSSVAYGVNDSGEIVGAYQGLKLQDAWIQLEGRQVQKT